MSMRKLYQDECAKLQVKVNSAIVKELPDDSTQLEEWNLSGNIVGTRGVVPILKVVEAMPKMRTLNLRGNNLTSPATKEILASVVKHPSITAVDVSNNDIRLGGPELIELLKRNRRIVELAIAGTHLRPLFERLIAIQIKKNVEFQAKVNPKKPEEAKRQDAPPSRGKVSFGEPTAAAEPEEAPFSFGAAAPADGEGGGDDGFVAFGDGPAVSFNIAANAMGGKKVPRRPTVCSEVYKEDEIENFVPEVIEKPQKNREWLLRLLERHNLFSHLEDFEIYQAVDAMYECNKEKGATLYEQDEDETDLFYIVYSGEVELQVNGETVDTITKGGYFSELMLMYPQAPKETATCKTEAVIYTLDRKTYRCILSKASKKKRAMYEGFLSGVGFLKHLSKPELLQLADALKPATFDAGETMIKYGEDGETFFLIVEGVVEVYGRDKEKNVIKVCEFGVGDCVGELEFINGHKCVADVKAKGFLRTAKMNRHHFEMVMGPVKDILARNAMENTKYEYYRGQLSELKDHPEGEAKPAGAEKK